MKTSTQDSKKTFHYLYHTSIRALWYTE